MWPSYRAQTTKNYITTEFSHRTFARHKQTRLLFSHKLKTNWAANGLHDFLTATVAAMAAEAPK